MDYESSTAYVLSILEENITLSVDIMKVTGIPFLMTISTHIKFGSAGKLDTMKNSHMIKHFKAIIGAYVARGYVEDGTWMLWERLTSLQSPSQNLDKRRGRG